MLRFAILSSIVALAACRPGIVSSSYGGGGGGSDFSHIDIGSLPLSGGDDHGFDTSSLALAGHTLDLGGGGGGGYSVDAGHGASGGGGGGESGGGDFHHGVSIVGGGGGQQGQTIDLTHGHGHHGPFGGSFVASSKYSAHDGSGGHGEGHGYGGGGGGYGVLEGGSDIHYSDVLGASEHLGGGGGYESLGGHGFH